MTDRVDMNGLLASIAVHEADGTMRDRWNASIRALARERDEAEALLLDLRNRVQNERDEYGCWTGHGPGGYLRDALATARTHLTHAGLLGASEEGEGR